MPQVPIRPKIEPFASFGKLPPELQVLILQHAFTDEPSEYLTYLGDGEPERAPLESKREQLKAIRLVSHVFHDAVTHAVFASIHIHASDLSIARAENIANSRLAGHVKEIVFHQGSFAYRNRDKTLFFSTLASNRRRQDYPPKLRSADRNKLYLNFLEEVEAASLFPAGQGGGFLKYQIIELTKKLPHLLTFVSLPYHNEWHDPETSAYTLRRTGLSYLPQPTGNSLRVQENDENFVRSMAEFQPRRLNMSLFPTSNLHFIINLLPSRVQTGLYKIGGTIDSIPQWTEEKFSELTDLKIGPAYGAKYGYGAGIDGELNRDTSVLLQAAVKLTHLELTNDYPMSRTFTLLPKGYLPKLRTLVVSRGTTLGHWPENALAKCIMNVGQSLKHLRFDGIALKDWRHGSEGDTADAGYRAVADVPAGCLIRLLYRITSSTNLESCTGLESVEDLKSRSYGESKNVGAGPKPGRKVLVDKLERAVCHELPWPVIVHPNQLLFENMSKLRWNDPREGAVLAFVCNKWADTIDEFAIFE